VQTETSQGNNCARLGDFLFTLDTRLTASILDVFLCFLSCDSVVMKLQQLSDQYDTYSSTRTDV